MVDLVPNHIIVDVRSFEADIQCVLALYLASKACKFEWIIFHSLQVLVEAPESTARNTSQHIDIIVHP